MNFESEFKQYNFPLLGLVRLPEIFIDDREKIKRKLPLHISNLEFLVSLVKEGLDKKLHLIDKKNLPKYFDQIDFELNIIEELSFTDYFLLVWMVINKARELGAFIDAGRGSAGASLLFWLIGVTGIDPIKKELIFSRFISKVRAKKQVIKGITYLQGDLAPDVDLNLGGVRDEILIWLKDLYKGRIAKISNTVEFSSKILIKDAYKVIEECDETEAKRISDMIDKHFGVVEDLQEMVDKNEEFKKWTEEHPKTFLIALKLRNLIRQKSSHASGYLISYDNLNAQAPLELNKEGELTVSYNMVDASDIAIKLDLLGLTTNQMIKNILENIPEKVEDINLEDNPIIYDQLQLNNLLPYGLYQISSDCAYRTVNQVKPKNVDEMADVNALARPGAFDYLPGYISKEAECPNKVFENILKRTRNICLYQEQMMQMLMAVGFSADEAEICRKIVGKKLIDKVIEWKDKIYKKCGDNGFEQNVPDVLWKILNDSAKYSFNMCLSPDTVVETKSGYKMMYEINIEDEIKSYDIDNQQDIYTEVINIYDNKAELYEIELEDGRKIKSSMNHKYLCEDKKMRTLEEILLKKHKIITD